VYTRRHTHTHDRHRQTLSHTCTHAHTHTHIHTHTHTHTQLKHGIDTEDTQTHTHTHTHTHTQIHSCTCLLARHVDDGTGVARVSVGDPYLLADILQFESASLRKLLLEVAKKGELKYEKPKGDSQSTGTGTYAALLADMRRCDGRGRMVLHATQYFFPSGSGGIEPSKLKQKVCLCFYVCVCECSALTVLTHTHTHTHTHSR
jgi:hypothetical protein